jgi:hypothetical protein
MGRGRRCLLLWLLRVHVPAGTGACCVRGGGGGAAAADRQQAAAGRQQAAAAAGGGALCLLERSLFSSGALWPQVKIPESPSVSQPRVRRPPAQVQASLLSAG